MVRIKEKKTIDSVREENALNVENKYEEEAKEIEEVANRELTEEESNILSKWLNELDRLWMSNLQNEGRAYFYKEEIVALLNSLID